MTWTKENMFEPSGCLTREAFEALVNRQLPSEAKAVADEHLALCPFCSDALEGFTVHAQETGFAVLMDQADEGFASIVTKNHSKSDRKKILWISVSAAASMLMLLGLFLLMNQPKPKLQVAQTLTRDTTAEKQLSKPKQLAEINKSEENKAAEYKTTSAKPKKATVRFSPPEVIDSEDYTSSTEDRLAAEVSTDAPKTNPAVAEEKAVVADEISIEKEADKADAKGMAYAKRAAESPAMKSVSGREEEVPLAFVEQMPQYPGGTEAMMKFISENLQYPKTASEMGISGKVILQLVIDKEGKVSDVKVLRGIGGGCDEEAMRVVKLMPAWKPGTQNGKPVTVYFILPILFNLTK